MKWFDAGTKKMSVPSLGNFISCTVTVCRPDSKSGTGLGPPAAGGPHRAQATRLLQTDSPGNSNGRRRSLNRHRTVPVTEKVTVTVTADYWCARPE